MSSLCDSILRWAIHGRLAPTNAGIGLQRLSFAADKLATLVILKCFDLATSLVLGVGLECHKCVERLALVAQWVDGVETTSIVMEAHKITIA